VIWGSWLGFSDTENVNPTLVAMAVTLAVIPITATLAGPDDALERTASLPWSPRRAAHLLIWAVTIIGLMLATQLTPTRYTPIGLILRDVTGLLGLTALGAVILGVRNAWIAPITWSLISAMLTATPLAHDQKTYQQILTWTLNGTSSATATAITFAITGSISYTIYGCRLSTTQQL
jgi:hypothetical protein